MKIIEVNHFRLDMALAVPYTIAYETVSQAANIVIEIKTDTGLTGWGCAAPDLAVTGESPEQVSEAAGSVITDLLIGENPFEIARLTHLLKQHLPQRPATMAMVDMALHDLLARKAGLPLYQLLGGFRDRIATSVTIGIVSLDETLEWAKKHLSDGFEIIKLKGGLNLDEDVEKILKLRELCGPGLSLRFDANQGYSVDQSILFMQRVNSAGLEIIEQPTSRKKDISLGLASQATSVPVMADESVSTLSDAFRLAADQRMDMINIKLMKMGGIFESLHINSVAKAAGLEIMVGCLDESALGISAGLHFALSRANIEFADLDGHLDLLDDPFSGLFHLQKGILYPTDQPGLGQINM
jgi:L-alanine-DL-glutamate epimerase-like enolase superfamily enzyme